MKYRKKIPLMMMTVKYNGDDSVVDDDDEDMIDNDLDGR